MVVITEEIEKERDRRLKSPSANGKEVTVEAEAALNISILSSSKMSKKTQFTYPFAAVTP